eukprot:4069495-Karenia_brevis.AAC.1
MELADASADDGDTAEDVASGSDSLDARIEQPLDAEVTRRFGKRVNFASEDSSDERTEEDVVEAEDNDESMDVATLKRASDELTDNAALGRLVRTRFVGPRARSNAPY